MKKIKSIQAAGIFIMIIYSCGSIINKQEDNNIRAVRVTQIFPYLNENGKLLGYDTGNVNIYYHGDQILYSDFYPWQQIMDGVVTRKETRQNFFVYTIDKRYGLLYDKHTLVLDKRILVDSMLKLQWYTNFKLAPAFLELISTEYHADSGILKRLYSFRGKVDTSMRGSSFLSFNKKLKGIEFSLAEEQDTVKNMRLYGMRNITYGRYFKAHNVTVDTVEQVFKLEEIPIANKSEILYYFNREKKYNKKN